EAFRGEVPAAARRVQAADPRAERKAYDREGLLLVRLERVAEDLLEPTRDGELIGNEARPERRLPRRARRDGDHVASVEPARTAEIGQRVDRKVVLLGDERDLAEVVDGVDRAGLDALRREEARIRRHAGRDLVEERQGSRVGVAWAAGEGVV